MTAIRVGGVRLARSHLRVGVGFIGGAAPTDHSPGAPDGRARKNNVPGVVRINLHERGNMEIVDSVLSDASGTWLIEWLNPGLTFVVTGFDDRGEVNAAIQDWVRPHVPEP